MSEEIKTYTDTNWEDLLEYNGMTWINIDRFKFLQQKVEQLEKDFKETNDLALNLISKNRQLENIRKEAIEFVEHNQYYFPRPNDLLNILNKENNKE